LFTQWYDLIAWCWHDSHSLLVCVWQVVQQVCECGWSVARTAVDSVWRWLWQMNWSLCHR